MTSFRDILKDPEVHDRLQRLTAHHPETYAHSVRVGLSMFQMAQLLQAEPETAARAGLLHDIGKIHVPVAILDKTSELTQAEREIVRMHTRYGATELISYDPKLAAVAGGHHEHQKDPYMRSTSRSNGILTQLVTLTDHTDALTHPRAYRNGAVYPLDAALKGLQDIFTGDPYLMKVFLDVAPHITQK